MPGDPQDPAAAPRPFRPATPVVIGILGGIAAGKSAVAELFAGHGLRHVDADAIARQVATEPAVVEAIGRSFGPAVLQDGQLDRAALGRVVFGDPTARQRLEAILHPPILARIQAALAAARQSGDSALLDAPLLLETGLDALCDEIVFVAAAAPTRAARAAARGWPADELARREAAQRPLAAKQARATCTVHNDGPLAATAQQIATWLAELAERPR